MRMGASAFLAKSASLAEVIGAVKGSRPMRTPREGLRRGAAGFLEYFEKFFAELLRTLQSEVRRKSLLRASVNRSAVIESDRAGSYNGATTAGERRIDDTRTLDIGREEGKGRGPARRAGALRTNEKRMRGQKEAFQAAIHGAPLEDSLGILARIVTEETAGEARTPSISPTRTSPACTRSEARETCPNPT